MPIALRSVPPLFDSSASMLFRGSINVVNVIGELIAPTERSTTNAEHRGWVGHARRVVLRGRVFALGLAC